MRRFLICLVLPPDGIPLSGPNSAAFKMDKKDPPLILLHPGGRTMGSWEESFKPSSRSSSSMSHSHSSINPDEPVSQSPLPPQVLGTSQSHRRGSLSKVQCAFSYYEPSRHADAKSSSVLPDEEDRMCSLCPTQDSIQVRLDSPSHMICSPLWYHTVLINLAMTLFVWLHTGRDISPHGPTGSSPGCAAQPML